MLGRTAGSGRVPSVTSIVVRDDPDHREKVRPRCGWQPDVADQQGAGEAEEEHPAAQALRQPPRQHARYGDNAKDSRRG